ncbi:MAG: hypothetical protein WDM78_13205 [Puia sp.]
MNPDRIAQAQLAYQQLLELNIQYEESVLNLMKYPNNHEIRNIKEEMAYKVRQWEREIHEGICRPHHAGGNLSRDLNTYNATQSL